MKIRPDVAELLKAGYSNAAIARQLNVCAQTTVAPAHTALGIPKAKSGYKPAASAEDLFWRRVKPTDDGHMEWAGYRTGDGVPGLAPPSHTTCRRCPARPKGHPMTTTPRRIQRRRTKGWRAPHGAVYVGRGSRWGNPYRLGDTQVRLPGIDGSEWQHEGRLGKRSGERHGFWHPDGTITSHLVLDATPEQVIELYRRWLTGRPELLAAVREQVAGRDLMCWCPLVDANGKPVPCHADVLLELANAEAGR